MSVFVGVDIGGTKTAAAWVDANGRSGAVLEVPTRTDSADGLVDSIVELVALVEADLPDGQAIDGVGLGIAGLVDETGRRVRFATHLAMRDHATADVLERRLGVRVSLENDGTAAAWGEFIHGAARDSTSLVMVSVGTGIGGGMVMDGRLYRGATGAAAELGHVSYVPDGHPCPCGQRGCWEQYSSGRALGRFAREAAVVDAERAAALLRLVDGDAAALTGEHVSIAAAEGDPLALDLVAELARHLGTGLAGIVAALDPDTIVIGGGVARLGEMLIDRVRTEMHDRTMGRSFRRPPVVVRAELGPQAAMIGAAASARLLAGSR